jgi:hypothetical protein
MKEVDMDTVNKGSRWYGVKRVVGVLGQQTYLLQQRVDVDVPRLEVLLDALGDALVMRGNDLTAVIPVHLSAHGR